MPYPVFQLVEAPLAQRLEQAGEVWGFWASGRVGPWYGGEGCVRGSTQGSSDTTYLRSDAKNSIQVVES